MKSTSLRCATAFTLALSLLPAACPAAPAVGQVGQIAADQGPAPLVGRIAAKGDKSFLLQPIPPGTQVKVGVGGATRFMKIETGGKLADVTEGSLVLATGPRDGSKLTAEDVLHGMKLAGLPSPEQRAALLPIARIVPLLHGEAGPQGQPAPVIGRVSSVKGGVITLQTPEGDVAVQTSDKTRFASLLDTTLAGLPAEGNVLVAPREEPKDGAAAAAMVCQFWMPAGGMQPQIGPTTSASFRPGKALKEGVRPPSKR